MKRARAGDLDVAARAELDLLGIRYPTPGQLAGATLRAWQAWEIHCLRLAWSTKGSE